MASKGVYLVSLLLSTVAVASSLPFYASDPVAEPPPVVTRSLKSANNLSINIHSNGNYEVIQNGTTWLHNSATFFQSRGHMYSTNGGSLHQINFGNVESGWDNLGEYSSVSVTWQTQDCDFVSAVSDDDPVAEPPPCTKSTVVTSVRAYKLSPLIVFGQNFKNVGFSGTSVNDKNSVCTGFPTFQIGNTQNLGYISYGGVFLGSTKIGRWTKGTSDIQSGVDGGPLVLFDQQQRTMVVAPFREFMASSIHHNTQTNAVEWGVLGSVTNIPKDFNYETALVFGERIKTTIEDYGSLLLKHYGKSRDYEMSDFTSNYLGYWTDNGAYYYYNTEPGMNYDETLIQVAKNGVLWKIPYRYFQIDSWWYYKGMGGGVKNWTARPDIFPNGLQDFYNRLGLPLVAHNRYWANDTQYAKSNGGQWNFIVEPENQKSIPQDEGFWNYLLSTSRDWGLIVYEQDWLSKEFDEMTATLQNVMVGRTWMNTMGAGASMNDIPIQFCMPTPRHLLQSVEMPTVTQSRASGDYQPGNTQWNIGLSSIMLHALGIRPFKDNFWTSPVQSGSPYKDRKETNPQLQSVVATLSTGPVGPSDKLYGSNATLIMRSCNADGKLLQPSRPAMVLSGYIAWMSFGKTAINAADGIIWSTVSEIPFGMSQIVFGHILAIEVNEVTMLTPSSSDFGMNTLPPSMIFNDNDPVNSVVHFDEKTPLMLQPFGSDKFQLWHTTPVMKLKNNTVLILGELSKWVKVSPDRITDISLTQEAVSLTMTGAPKENVTMTFLFNTKPMPATCAFPENKKLILEVMNMGQFNCVTV